MLDLSLSLKFFVRICSSLRTCAIIFFVPPNKSVLGKRFPFYKTSCVKKHQIFIHTVKVKQSCFTKSHCKRYKILMLCVKKGILIPFGQNVKTNINKIFRDVSRSVLIAFNRYGHPKNCPNFSLRPNK